MTLLQRIDRHLRAHRLTPTRFGREAANDPRLMRDLRRGREPRARLVARIEAYLDASAEQGR